MIELSEVIRDLRVELQHAIEAGKDEALHFGLGDIELEVTVAVERTGGGEAKVRFWIVELGADASATGTSTQRIKLTLSPQLGPTGARPQVSGRAAEGERTD